VMRERLHWLFSVSFIFNWRCVICWIMQTKGWEQVLILVLTFILQFWESGAWTHICIIHKWMSINSNVLFPKCLWFTDQSIQEEHTFCLINKWAVPALTWIFWPSKQNLHSVYRVSIFLMIWLLAEEDLLSSIQLTWKLGLQGDGCWFKDCREGFKPVFCMHSWWFNVAFFGLTGTYYNEYISMEQCHQGGIKVQSINSWNRHSWPQYQELDICYLSINS
jgi:hypothetical protein